MDEKIFRTRKVTDKETKSLNIEQYLTQFTQNEAIYQWNGSGNPEIAETEEIILVFEEKFALYEENKLKNCTIIFTSERVIISGMEVKGTLVASMVSREVEERRSSTYKPERLLPQIIKGWDGPHNNITRIEIIKTGKYYSLFFFQQDHRLYIINDVNSEEMTIVTNYLSEKFDIETVHSDFRIPVSDILLLIGAGIILTIVGWIIIAIIF